LKIVCIDKQSPQAEAKARHQQALPDFEYIKARISVVREPRNWNSTKAALDWRAVVDAEWFSGLCRLSNTFRYIIFMQAKTLTAVQQAMRQREQRHRTDRKRRAAIRWRSAARERASETQREEELLTSGRELTIDELFELAGDPKDWQQITEKDFEGMKLEPGDLQPFSQEGAPNVAARGGPLRLLIRRGRR
jgi:hypothetical protein